MDLAAGGKGRNAGEQFAHIHNVRLMWLKAAAPQLLTDLQKLETVDAIKKDLLISNLEDSGKAIITLLDEAVSSGKIKGFKPHARRSSAILFHTNHITGDE